MSEKMQPPSFAGASPFLLLRYVAVAPLMAPQLVCPSLSCADLNKRLIYSSPLDCRHLYHLSPRKWSVNGRLYYDPLLSPGAKLHHDKAGAQGRDAELQTWKHNTRGGQKFTKWNMMEHGHSCPKRSCPCHTLLQYYARHTCCWKELWEVREVEDQDICTQSLVESLCSSDQSVGWYIVCTLLWRTSVQDWVQAQKHSPTQVHGYQCVLEAEATQAPIIISN